MINHYPPIVTVVLIFLSALVCSGEKSPETPYLANFYSTLIDDGKDLIFPSIIRAEDYFEAPLSKYYLYTSPHGGADIRLYLSDAITGPWRLHGTIVGKEVGRADHVSSPHAVWNDEADALFLYVHAPNAQTIYCYSKDGINFEYGGVCVPRYYIS